MNQGKNEKMPIFTNYQDFQISGNYYNEPLLFLLFDCKIILLIPLGPGLFNQFFPNHKFINHNFWSLFKYEIFFFNSKRNESSIAARNVEPKFTEQLPFGQILE